MCIKIEIKCSFWQNMMFHIITLKIQVLSLVESHDLLDDVTQNFVHSVTHSRTQSPSYARCDEGLWPNP